MYAALRLGFGNSLYTMHTRLVLQAGEGTRSFDAENHFLDALTPFPVFDLRSRVEDIFRERVLRLVTTVEF